MKVRSGFMGAFVGMIGVIVPWALVARDPVPLIIWVIAFLLVLTAGRPDER